MAFGVGQSVTRKEDPRFLTGRGKYVADIDMARQTHGVFIFSPYAHATIKSIDAAAALKAPGVVGVLTGKDYVADKLGPIMAEAMPEDFGGPKGYRSQHFPLAVERVRYVGERVAIVIAETEAQARDAVDLVNIEYEELPVVVRATDAVKAGAAQVYAESPNNICFTLRMGNVDAVEPAFAKAAHVTKLELFNNRLNAFTMEPRGCLAEYDSGTGRFTVYSSTQNPHGLRHGLSHVMHLPEASFRVIAKDVGGGFGMKGNLYPEEVVVPWAAKKVGRPVKWIPTRSEALLGDDQGRDIFVTAELALDAEGKFLALRWKGLHNVGAYIEGSGIVPVMFVMKLAPTVYDIPAVAVFNSAVYTNTPPTIPYRGAGRPEAVYIMERLIDKAAHEMKLDRAEIRKKNFIKPAAMPFATKTGWTYDSGDFAAAMGKAQALADWNGYEGRKAASEKSGRKRGRGIVAYVDNTGIFNDRMEIRFDPSGMCTVHAGTFSHGQGHETVYPQMVAGWLGIPIETCALCSGRYRSGRGRPRHLCLALDDGRRQRLARGGRRGDRERQALGGAFSRSRARRHHLRRRQVHHRRHRQGDAAAKARGDVVHPGRHPGRAWRRPDRRGRVLGQRAELPQWLPYLRGRDRRRYRLGDDRALHRGRRYRHGDQSAARAGPNPWRRGAGRRPGAARRHHP